MTQVALALGLVTTTADVAWAQFQEGTPFPVQAEPTPVLPPPPPQPRRFQEAPDTNTFVSDEVRREATNFLDQENLSLKADAELDFDTRIPEGEKAEYDAGGRIRVTFEGNHTAGERYITGRAEALYREDGGAGVDDVWIAFGDDTWDLQLGRFEGINLFPLGLDTVLAHAGDRSLARVYEINLARGRVGLDSGGGVAFRYRFNEMVRFELDTAWGDLRGEGEKTDPVTGVRPSLALSQGPYSVTVGGEWVKLDLEGGGETEQYGGGASFRYDSKPILAHFNVSYLVDDSPTTQAKVVSGAANLIYDGKGTMPYNGTFGIGVVHSRTDLDNSSLDPQVTTGYIAYVAPVFGFDRFKVSFGGSYSVADDAGPEDSRGAVRVRFNYAF